MSLLSVLISPVPVAAGYPSPAQDYFDGRIDLNEHLIKDITSTYVVRVSGDSMDGAGISDGDELTVNRLRITATGVVLQAENPAYPDIRVPSVADLVIWGVATRCLHHV